MFGFVSKKKLRTSLKILKDYARTVEDQYQILLKERLGENRLKEENENLLSENKKQLDTITELKAKVRERTENDLVATSVRIIMASFLPERKEELPGLEAEQRRLQALRATMGSGGLSGGLSGGFGYFGRL